VSRVRRFEQQITVSAPVDAVEAVILDVEDWPEWTASVRSARRLDEGSLAVGSKAEITQPGLPVMTWTVTEVSPGQGFTWETERAGVRTVGRHELRSTGADTTDVTLVVEQSGPLAGILSLLAGGKIKANIALEAEGLRRQAEGGGAAGSVVAPEAETAPESDGPPTPGRTDGTDGIDGIDGIDGTPP
jgi:uncharacterized membrane protein